MYHLWKFIFWLTWNIYYRSAVVRPANFYEKGNWFCKAVNGQTRWVQLGSFEQNFKRRNEGKQRRIGLGGRKAEDDNERTGYWFPFRIGRNDIGREEDVDGLLKKW